MVQNPSTNAPSGSSATAFAPGGETGLQKELLETYRRMSQAWLDRVQAETELWTHLAGQLASAPSVTDALQSYTACLSKQIQMSAEDGRRLFSDYQEIAEKIAKSVSASRQTSLTH